VIQGNANGRADNRIAELQMLHSSRWRRFASVIWVEKKLRSGNAA